jgi:hypothetical protein
MKEIGSWYNWIDGTGPTAIASVPEDQRFRNLIVSGGNNRASYRNGSYHSGGNFLLAGTDFIREPSDVGKLHRHNRHPEYIGSVTAVSPALPEKPLIGRPLEDYGPELYNQSKPAKPDMFLGNGIYELKDVPDMLRQRFTPDFRGISNYYLALKFGWEPLLSDIRDFVTKQRDVSKRIDQLLKDRGKPVRRRSKNRLSHSAHVTGVEHTYGAFEQVFVTQTYAGVPTLTYSDVSEEDIWSSGQFTYDFSDVDVGSDRWKRSMLRRLYGLNPSPYVIWKALPWTWLVDWCSNVGDNIANVQSEVADSLRTDYYYLMRTTTEKKVATATCPFHTGYEEETITLTATTTNARFVKERVAGSPFGLAVGEKPSGFSQAAIITALGLSRI